MGEFADAIREHLELKRQRGADAAEVAREEHEALAPVTRSHPVVFAPAAGPDEQDAPEPEADDPGPEREAKPEAEAHPDADADAEPDDEVDDDATQEFRVEHDGDWLAAGD